MCLKSSFFYNPHTWYNFFYHYKKGELININKVEIRTIDSLLYSFMTFKGNVNGKEKLRAPIPYAKRK